jgi:hypothetical protein
MPPVVDPESDQTFPAESEGSSGSQLLDAFNDETASRSRPRNSAWRFGMEEAPPCLTPA